MGFHQFCSDLKIFFATCDKKSKILVFLLNIILFSVFYSFSLSISLELYGYGIWERAVSIIDSDVWHKVSRKNKILVVIL